MRWASDWRLYYVAAGLFLIAACIAFLKDGIGLRPVLGLVMSIVLVMLGSKARREGPGGPAPG